MILFIYVYFSLCSLKDDAEPRDFKLIIQALRKACGE